MNNQTTENNEVFDIIMSKTIKRPTVYVDESWSEEKQNEEYQKATKLYLILWSKIDTVKDETINNYQFILGTQLTYDTIKEALESEREDKLLYNVKESLVIVDSPKVKLTNAISLYSFMKVMKDRNKVEDDSLFDIDDYIDYEE